MTIRPNIPRVSSRGRAATRKTYTDRHHPVTVWLTAAQRAALAQYVARQRIADPLARTSVSGALRDLAMGVLGVLDLASVPGEADPTEDGTSGPTSDPSSSPATIAVPTSVETATDDAHVVSYVIDGADVRRVRATCSCGWGSPWSSDMVSHPFLGTEPGRRAVLDAVLHQREMGARCEGIEPRLALGRLP